MSFFFKMLVFFQKTSNSLSERVCVWTNQIRNLKIKVGGMEHPRLCHTLMKSKNSYVEKIKIMKNNKSKLNYCFSMSSLWGSLFNKAKDNAVWQLSLPRSRCQDRNKGCEGKLSDHGVSLILWKYWGKNELGRKSSSLWYSSVWESFSQSDEELHPRKLPESSPGMASPYTSAFLIC